MLINFYLISSWKHIFINTFRNNQTNFFRSSLILSGEAFYFPKQINNFQQLLNLNSATNIYVWKSAVLENFVDPMTQLQLLLTQDFFVKVLKSNNKELKVKNVNIEMDLARQNGTFEKYLEIIQRICDDRFAGVSKTKGKKQK